MADRLGTVCGTDDEFRIIRRGARGGERIQVDHGGLAPIWAGSASSYRSIEGICRIGQLIPCVCRVGVIEGLDEEALGIDRCLASCSETQIGIGEHTGGGGAALRTWRVDREHI